MFFFSFFLVFSERWIPERIYKESREKSNREARLRIPLRKRRLTSKGYWELGKDRGKRSRLDRAVKAYQDEL
jgi:hypothetical protein